MSTEQSGHTANSWLVSGPLHPAYFPPRTKSPAADACQAWQLRAVTLAWLATLLILMTFCSVSLALDLPELQKPPPSARMQPFRERVTALVRQHYPQLLTEKQAGTAFLIVLFNSDGTIAASDVQTYASHSMTLTADETQFERFGLQGGEMRYVGVDRITLPSGSVLVIFGARSSQSLDRALVQRYFPRVLTEGPAADQTLWILFDHAGNVLSFGQDTLIAIDLKYALEARFPEIRISDTSVTRVVVHEEHPEQSCPGDRVAQLHLLWLAPDSPVPNAIAQAWRH